MNNDQRLIPFLGGLVIGGAAGSQTARYPYYYYPPYYGPNYTYYPTQYVQQVPNTQAYYPYNDYQSEYNLAQKNISNSMYEQRNMEDLSFVPIYNDENNN